MNKTRLILFGSVIASAMIFGAAFGATVFARGTLTNALAAIPAAASPSPTFKSNEDATHEKNESAAQEAAENNGTFHPGGPGGPGGHPRAADRATPMKRQPTNQQRARRSKPAKTPRVRRRPRQPHRADSGRSLSSAV